jgi:hypothetical protein
MQLGPYALGRHAFFYPDGQIITVPAAGTGSVAGASSRTNKPDPTDPLYIDTGAIDDWTDDFKSNGDEKIYRAAPGRRVLYNIVEKGADGMYKWTTQEIIAYAVATMYRTSQALTSAGGQFNPNSATPKTGWLHFELYDQNNNFFGSVDQYGLLRIVGGWETKEGGIIKPQWELNCFYSTLNTGLLNNS